MDIKCHLCGEPWEVDTLHEAVEEEMFDTFDEAREEFYRVGCWAVGARHGAGAYVHSEAVAELQYLLGDDVDGLAALEEDFGL